MALTDVICDAPVSLTASLFTESNTQKHSLVTNQYVK